MRLKKQHYKILAFAFALTNLFMLTGLLWVLLRTAIWPPSREVVVIAKDAKSFPFEFRPNVTRESGIIDSEGNVNRKIYTQPVIHSTGKNSSEFEFSPPVEKEVLGSEREEEGDLYTKKNSERIRSGYGFDVVDGIEVQTTRENGELNTTETIGVNNNGLNTTERIVFDNEQLNTTEQIVFDNEQLNTTEQIVFDNEQLNTTEQIVFDNEQLNTTERIVFDNEQLNTTEKIVFDNEQLNTTEKIVFDNNGLNTTEQIVFDNNGLNTTEQIVFDNEQLNTTEKIVFDNEQLNTTEQIVFDNEQLNTTEQIVFDNEQLNTTEKIIFDNLPLNYTQNNQLNATEDNQFNTTGSILQLNNAQRNVTLPHSETDKNHNIKNISDHQIFNTTQANALKATSQALIKSTTSKPSRISIFAESDSVTKFELSYSPDKKIGFEWTVDNKTINVFLDTLSESFRVPESFKIESIMLRFGDLVFPKSAIIFDKEAKHATLGLLSTSNKSFISSLQQYNPRMKPQFSFRFASNPNSVIAHMGRLAFNRTPSSFPFSLKSTKKGALELPLVKIEMPSDNFALSKNLVAKMDVSNEKYNIPTAMLHSLAQKLGLEMDSNGIYYCNAKKTKTLGPMRIHLRGCSFSFNNGGYMIRRGSDRFEFGFKSDSTMPQAEESVYLGSLFFRMYNLHFDYSTNEIFLGNE